MSFYLGRPIAPSYMSPNVGGRGGVAASQPMSTAEHRSQNKLWRSNSICNLWVRCFNFVNTNTVEDSAQNVWQSLLLDFYISPTVGGAGSSGINLHNYSPFLHSKCLSGRETQETNSCQINKQTQKNYTASKKQRFSLTLFTKIVFFNFICMFCILYRMNCNVKTRELLTQDSSLIPVR